MAVTTDCRPLFRATDLKHMYLTRLHELLCTGDSCNCTYVHNTRLWERIMCHFPQCRHSHCGQKPYLCQLCGRALTRRRSLIRHSAVHTKEKAFKCVLCNNRYTQASSLNRHVKKGMKMSDNFYDDHSWWRGSAERCGRWRCPWHGVGRASRQAGKGFHSAIVYTTLQCVIRLSNLTVLLTHWRTRIWHIEEANSS